MVSFMVAHTERAENGRPLFTCVAAFGRRPFTNRRGISRPLRRVVTPEKSEIEFVLPAPKEFVCGIVTQGVLQICYLVSAGLAPFQPALSSPPP